MQTGSIGIPEKIQDLEADYFFDKSNEFEEVIEVLKKLILSR